MQQLTATPKHSEHVLIKVDVLRCHHETSCKQKDVQPPVICCSDPVFRCQMKSHFEGGPPQTHFSTYQVFLKWVMNYTAG